jgi:hypothetical protein
MSAVESNQIAQDEKVTALVPGVENGSEILWRLQSMQNLATFWRSISSEEVCRPRVSPFYFWRGIDLIPRVGYAYKTFAVRPLND